MDHRWLPARMSGDMDHARRLEQSSTCDWWKHMKSLMGTSSGSQNEMQGLANKYTDGNIDTLDSLVNSINGFFVSLSEHKYCSLLQDTQISYVLCDM